jgi:Mg-chelatase subunit ChlD
MTRIALSATVDRPLFARAGGSYRYLVVRLEAERADEATRSEPQPLNIALAIDASGSMNGASSRPPGAPRSALSTG